jgi:hypothetical protein
MVVPSPTHTTRPHLSRVESFLPQGENRVNDFITIDIMMRACSHAGVVQAAAAVTVACYVLRMGVRKLPWYMQICVIG